MKAVVKYQANDGSLFDDEATASSHDKFLAALKTLEATLPPLPQNDGCSFANGDGYIQHDSATVRAYKQAILRLAAERKLGFKFAEWVDHPDDVHPHGVVGRILSDGDRHLYKAWYRMMCMDDQLREWGQPYFALNPGTGKSFEIKRRAA